MNLQVSITSGNPDEPDQIIAFAEPDPIPGWKFTDVDGDRIGVWPAVIPGVGRGVNIRTDRLGCSIPLGEVDAFIQAVRDAAAREGGDG